MKILFCGCCLPRKFEKRIEMLSVAGNQYQNNLIANLRKLGEVKVLSYVNIPIEIDKSEIKRECNRSNYQVVFSTSKRESIKEYRKLMREQVEWADYVIAYNSMYPWFGIGKLAAKVNTKSVLVLADYTPSREQKSFARKLYAFFMNIDFKMYSKIVLLSEGSEKYVSRRQERIVINGCIDEKKFENVKEASCSKIKNIVYSGVLSYVTGVDLLIEAFSKIEGENYRLVICGQGKELDELIKNASSKDSRIIFKGFLSTEEYMSTIEQASVLVNPRNMNYSQNQNNFPSKVLEYLASGRPVVSTKFRGYELYRNNIIFADSSANGIRIGIKDALELDPKETYKKNRDFIKSFTWEQQIRKFL